MSHSHGSAVTLTPEQKAILEDGLERLIEMTEGLEFIPLPSAKYPLPLSSVAYRTLPDARTVRRDVANTMKDDLIRSLEPALALLELFETNQPGAADDVLDDMKFLGAAFSSKRANGWAAVLGDADVDEIELAVNKRWQFRFFKGRTRQAGLYLLLNALARYAFVYGRAPLGDAHDVAHFVEDHTPGLLMCRGKMDNLQTTLALMALKMGLPAIVPRNFPFPFGKTLRLDELGEIVDGAVAFPNIRRLINLPRIPGFPDFADPAHQDEQIEPAVVWGGADESFYVVRKGPVEDNDVRIAGPAPKGSAPIGIIVTIDAEPMDAFDRRYVERSIAGSLSMIKGVGFAFREGRLDVLIAKNASVEPEQVGEVLIAAVQHNFPKIHNASVEIIFDSHRLAELAPQIRSEIHRRSRDIDAASEENAASFYSCVGCSQFAPDHICFLTPERPPMCGRPFEMIKTGALYGYDDMSNIHHSDMYREFNSFSVFDKGECIDPERGEWTGVNLQAATLTRGHTKRVFLHSVDEFPHTGCGCFGLIIFRIEKPRPGIGIMERAFEGAAPDGRTWKDLYYQQAGKQTPGSTGANASYLKSPAFLKAHGGWESVVWVGPKIAAIMGDDLPDGVEVG